MATFVSLMRSINVAGNQIRMDELKNLYEALGFKDVVTYIRSGNVVFTSDDLDQTLLSKRIEDGFAEKFSFGAKAIVRSPDELKNILEKNPFQDEQTKDSKWMVVMFLATHPANGALEDLRRTYSGPEEMHLVGQELYIYYPTGIGRSKLSHTLIEKKLKTVGTGRNWNTVLQLEKMSRR